MDGYCYVEGSGVKGEILMLEKIFDNTTYKWVWQATIDFDELPDLKMGMCEVKQE